jgi:hypothetical protein
LSIIRWGTYKFPKETPLVFYKDGKPIEPPLSILDGLKLVLKTMASYIDREAPDTTLKLWRTQSPRHSSKSMRYHYYHSEFLISD